MQIRTTHGSQIRTSTGSKIHTGRSIIHFGSEMAFGTYKKKFRVYGYDKCRHEWRI